MAHGRQHRSMAHDITSNSAIEFLKGKNALKDGSPKDNVLIRRLKT